MPLKSGGSNPPEYLKVLDIGDHESVKEMKQKLKENMDSNDSFLIEYIDVYFQFGNKNLREVLMEIRPSQSKLVLNKIDEYMNKSSTKLKAISLFGHYIRKDITWVHEIVPSRSVFKTLMKCLQEDTDLPILTSALYALLTLIPKVAYQLPNHLLSLIKIFYRLVSWHSIKPEGANDQCLRFLHAAVYNLFLTLYGIFPNYFIKGLGEVYKLHIKSLPKMKGSNVYMEKMRLFENSIQPLLEQVRFNTNLISVSAENEVNPEKLKEMKAYDLIANIRRLSLDKTENSQIFEPLQMNSAHKNLTPSFNFQKANNSSPVKKNSPLVNLATLDENSIFSFNTTTPERTFEANSASPSPGVHLNVEKIVNVDQNTSLKQDLCKSLNFNPPMSLSKNNTTPTPQQIIVHAPQENNDESNSIALEMYQEFNIMMESIGSQYIEESPNQIRDLTVKLIQENYFRDNKQAGCGNEDAEWKSSSCSGEEMRQMMLQGHHTMAYERWRREMHARRSRVCMEKLNEMYYLREQCASAVLTEKNLKETILAHQKEREKYLNEFKLLKEEKEKDLTKKDEKIREVSDVLRSQEDEIKNLKHENNSLNKTNNELVDNLQEHQHKLFNLENLKRDETINKKHVAIFEKKMNELKMRMAQIKFQNEQLLHERNSGKESTKNQLAEYKMFIDG